MRDEELAARALSFHALQLNITKPTSDDWKQSSRLMNELERGSKVLVSKDELDALRAVAEAAKNHHEEITICGKQSLFYTSGEMEDTIDDLDAVRGEQ